MYKRFLTLFLIGFGFSIAQAQSNSFKLGIRLGGGCSLNQGIGNILVPENFYSNYTFQDKWQAVPSAGIFVQYHSPNSLIGVEGGFSYWQKSSKLIYDDNKDLHYEVTPRYNFIGLTALVKCYPWKKGFNIHVGGRIGANLNEKGLVYKSNQEEEQFSKYHFATVDETQRIMREKLTGQPDISVGGGLGYEIGRHWAVDVRYLYGVTSTIKTELNDFNWVEHDTHSHQVELSFSYLFNL